MNTESLYNSLIFVLVNMAVAPTLAILGTAFGKKRREAILNALESDLYGIVVVLLSLAAIVVGVFVQGSWGGWLLNAGGLFLGIGILVALPKKATESLVDWHNVGLVIAILGLYGIWIYFLAPLGPAVEAAWISFREYLDWSLLYGLLAVPVTIFGFWIKIGRRHTESKL